MTHRVEGRALILAAHIVICACSDDEMMTAGSSSSTTEQTDPTETTSTTSSSSATESDTVTAGTTSSSESDSSTDTSDVTSAGATTDTAGGVCGDGVLDDGEECEPVLSDGCNDACLLDRWVFVTSKPYTSSFNDILNIDNHCLLLAIEAGLVPPDAQPLEYVVKAWVSSAAAWPAQDFVHHGGRYVLLGDDSPVIADDWDELTSGQLQHPIDRNEFGESIEYDDVVTNTKPDGTPASTEPEEMCDAWMWDTMSLPVPIVTVGEPDRVDGRWTEIFFGACDSTIRFYCFQQEVVE